MSRGGGHGVHLPPGHGVHPNARARATRARVCQHAIKSSRRARDHGTGTPPEPVSYTRGLLRRLAAGTLDDTDALPIRAARAAAERAERAAAASAASTAPAAPTPERTQPPEDLRAQLRAAARGRKP